MRAFKFLFLSLAFFLLIACNRSQVSNQTSEAILEDSILKPESKNEILCFQRVYNRDTSTIRLVINDNQVEGEFLHVPFEKDARKGTILGEKQDKFIKGMWSYMQEGKMDSLEIEFKLDNDDLLQKDYSIDASTGKQVLKDTSRFSILFTRIDCENFPKK